MRTIKIVAAVSLFIISFGCKGKEKVPGNILSQEKMKIVMEDMMKADQFLSDYVLNRDTSKKREPESIKIYNQVFAIHQITPEKFYKSFDFYQQHPGLLQPILDSLSKPVEMPAIIDVESDSTTSITPLKEKQ